MTSSVQGHKVVLGALFRWLLWISLPIALLLLPLYSLVTNTYVHWQYQQPSFPPSDRFTNAERIRLSDTIVNYLRGKASLEQMATMRTDSGEVAMRAQEVQHIVDVKRVMDWLYLAQLIASAITIAAAVGLTLVASWSHTGWALRVGVAATAAIIMLVVAASFINFDVFFDRLHRIFFTNNSWLFYYEDTLIQLYPEPLWISAVWQMGVVILIELAVLFGISWHPFRQRPAILKFLDNVN